VMLKENKIRVQLLDIDLLLLCTLLLDENSSSD